MGVVSGWILALRRTISNLLSSTASTARMLGWRGLEFRARSSEVANPRREMLAVFGPHRRRVRVCRACRMAPKRLAARISRGNCSSLQIPHSSRLRSRPMLAILSRHLPRGASSFRAGQDLEKRNRRAISLCACWETICRETGRTEGTALRAICRLSEKTQSFEPVNPTRQDRVRGARLSKFSDQRAQSRGSGR